MNSKFMFTALTIFLLISCSQIENPKLIIQGDFSLHPSKEGQNVNSCFDLDEGVNTENETADICMGQGPQEMSPVALAVVNGASKYLSESELDIETCQKHSDSYSITNIPDFPIYNICVRTNKNRISIITYLHDESWDFQTWQLIPDG